MRTGRRGARPGMYATSAETGRSGASERAGCDARAAPRGLRARAALGRRLLAGLLLVEVVLDDRALLALFGQDRPGDQVDQRARSSSEDRERCEDYPDDVGVDPEIIPDACADPGDHAPFSRPDQPLVPIGSVHTPIMPLPMGAQTAGVPAAAAAEPAGGGPWRDGLAHLGRQTPAAYA